jgi:hypothetical protein
MGGLLVVGAVLTLSSIIKTSALREMSGLVFLALGAAIYGGGVVLGLHNQGIVSGIGYAGITVTLLGRIFFLLRSATKQPVPLP